MIVRRSDNFTEAVKEAEHLNALCESMLTSPDHSSIIQTLRRQ